MTKTPLTPFNILIGKSKADEFESPSLLFWWRHSRGDQYKTLQIKMSRTLNPHTHTEPQHHRHTLAEACQAMVHFLGEGETFTVGGRRHASPPPLQALCIQHQCQFIINEVPLLEPELQCVSTHRIIIHYLLHFTLHSPPTYTQTNFLPQNRTFFSSLCGDN